MAKKMNWNNKLNIFRSKIKYNSKYVLYLAVLPKYRRECIEIVRDELGSELLILCSNSHLDTSVRTGIPASWFEEVLILRILGRVFIQFGGWAKAIKAETVVLDLNPRSITSWALLIVRRLLDKRTLVWGHINPRLGPNSQTVSIRLVMRKLAAGTISYTYSDRENALTALPNQPVWVASNALYKRSDIHPAATTQDRDAFVYVGRLVASKKPHILVEALTVLPDPIKLILVGAGSLEDELKNLARDLGVAHRIEFLGWIDSVDGLQDPYGRAFASVSPGFAGLGLTQSLGFGVPQVIARDELHSPEIELATNDAVEWFESDDVNSLAQALLRRWDRKSKVPNLEYSSSIRDRYSAESMASGLISALRGK